MYELFVGPPELDSEWDDRGIDGVFRYLNKVWKFYDEYKDKPAEPTEESEFIKNKMIKEIDSRLNALTMNTVVSGFMEYTNKMVDEAKKNNGIDRASIETLIVLLAPFTPHIAEEMWHGLGHETSVFEQAGLNADESKLVENSVVVAVQINGKVRENIKIAKDEAKESALEKAKASLGARLDGKTIVKEIYVPGRIINIVVK